MILKGENSLGHVTAVTADTAPASLALRQTFVVIIRPSYLVLRYVSIISIGMVYVYATFS